MAEPGPAAERPGSGGGRPRFGTDGLRGVANAGITAELALALGRAAARASGAQTFVVGRDTRRSSPMLQAALAAGLASEGVDVLDVGVLSTPGVAHVAEQQGVAAAVVSASHNPFGDNGVKLLSEGGTKLAPIVERAVEAELDRVLAEPEAPPLRPTGRGVGRIVADAEGPAAYREHLRRTLEGRHLGGLHVELDCANGAASALAPAVFAASGARVRTHAAEPDGTNINAGCGSTHPEALQRAVVEGGAQLGLAFDGDADRVLAVDHTGALVDGDRLLALFALDLLERGRLAGNGVVVTVMTNLWFRRAMAERAIAVVETPVGDRHVLAALDERGLVLGGEQSGHIVFRELATTGDGVLSGLVLADLLVRTGRTLRELASSLPDPVPQVLVNVAVADPARVASSEVLAEAVAVEEERLADAGRVLVRPSGTEPVVRVMVEALDGAQAQAVADRLRAVVEAELGLPAG